VLLDCKQQTGRAPSVNFTFGTFLLPFYELFLARKKQQQADKKRDFVETNP